MTSQSLLRAAQAAELAAAAVTPEEEMRAVMAITEHKEALRIGLLTAEMSRRSDNPTLEERLPLRDEGDDFAQVEARIPKELFFHFVQQRNFGMDGFCDNGGMKDFLKAYPSCRIKTVSGKTTVGYRGAANVPRRAPGIQFGRGTIQFAR